MKKQNLFAGCILCVVLLFSACGNTNNNNNEQQNSSKVKDEVNNSENQVPNTFTDSRDGKIYKTVKIGTQTWMTENLAYKTNSGCWAYDNKQSNVSTYGYLYNWGTAKIVCPTGWHLPSDAEWRTLTDYLGGESVAGGKLKETSTTHWQSPNTGANNESGFTALPSGNGGYDGVFYSIGEGCGWWCSTEDDVSYALFRTLYYGSNTIGRANGNKTNSLSVRCVKD